MKVQKNQRENGESAGYQLFLLFSQYFNFIPKEKFRLVQIESICRRQIECDLNDDFCLCKGRKYCWKKRKCWLPAFSSFPTMFSEGFLLKVIKSRDYVVKG